MLISFVQDLSVVPWMAPECILSVDEHTTASDVWSFGVLLYEIVTSGKRKYQPPSLSDAATITHSFSTLCLFVFVRCGPVF